MTDLKLQDEAGRLAALRSYEVLDTPREAAFDQITNLIKTIFDVPICTVSLVDKDRQWFKSCVGMPFQQTDRDVSFCAHTILERGAFFVPDMTLDPRFAQNPQVTGDPFIRSYLGVPLCSPDGYNVGSLCAIDIVPRTYTADQVQVLKSFADLVVNELELRRIAQVDHLTGAATRRGFTLEMEKALSKFLRSGSRSSLIVLDVDHFKRVNDTYGHPVGDFVLRSVTEKLSSHLRHGDTLGRLGGEEFGILLGNTGLDQALDAAERLRVHLASFQISSNPPLCVTASFGVATLDHETTAVEGWMATADEALYQAKKAGRNRCCTAAGVAAAA